MTIYALGYIQNTYCLFLLLYKQAYVIHGYIPSISKCKLI